MSSYKVGDRVWVQATVQRIDEKSLRLTFYDDWTLWFLASDCRPAEPSVIKEPLTTESSRPKIPDSSSDPLAPSPCMDGVNVDQFIEGVMEARGRTSDPVNPSHYRQGGIECIEAIKAALGEGFPDYLRGNVMKYLWRYKEKGGVDDLRKSAWYLDRLFKEVGE